MRSLVLKIGASLVTASVLSFGAWLAATTKDPRPTWPVWVFIGVFVLGVLLFASAFWWRKREALDATRDPAPVTQPTPELQGRSESGPKRQVAGVIFPHIAGGQSRSRNLTVNWPSSAGPGIDASGAGSHEMDGVAVNDTANTQLHQSEDPEVSEDPEDDPADS